MSYASITSEQSSKIFQLVAIDSKLKRLHMTDIDLSSVDPEILSRSVSKIEEVDLCNTNLTSLQIKRIFRFNNTESKLRSLTIRGNDLSQVNPKTLGNAIAMMKNVDVSNTNLVNKQYEEIFKCLDTKCNLKRLNLDDCWGNLPLHILDPGTKSRVVAKIEINYNCFYEEFDK